MSKEESDLFLITAEEAGNRIDKVLADRFKGSYSRTYFQYLIDHHCVEINGETVKKRALAASGDEVEIHFILTPELEVKPEPIALTILYEDDDLLVINKPSGMVVHPAPGHPTGTFANALLYHCQAGDLETNSLRPGIVHRLDKDTSGVLIAAKNNRTLERLVDQFTSRIPRKIYHAICIGHPGSQHIQAPIGRHPVHRKEMAVVSTGKPAETVIRTVTMKGNLSLVEANLLTGRTHQIRVHLRHVGTPILGDAVYGNGATNTKWGVERQLLHALSLELPHPTTGRLLAIKAPYPLDFQQFITKHF